MRKYDASTTTHSIKQTTQINRIEWNKRQPTHVMSCMSKYVMEPIQTRRCRIYEVNKPIESLSNPNNPINQLKSKRCQYQMTINYSVKHQYQYQLNIKSNLLKINQNQSIIKSYSTQTHIKTTSKTTQTQTNIKPRWHSLTNQIYKTMSIPNDY